MNPQKRMMTGGMFFPRLRPRALFSWRARIRPPARSLRRGGAERFSRKDAGCVGFRGEGQGLVGEWRESFGELGARLRRRSPLCRVAFGGLLGFVVASPFSISLAQICVFTAMAAWLASMGRGTPLLTERFPLWRPWLLFALFTLASAFHSPDTIQSLIKSKELTQIGIFYLALNVIEDDWEALWLVKALFFFAAAAALYPLAVSLQTSLSPHHRMAGFFSNSMTLGGFFLIVSTLALAYIFLPGKRWAGAWIYVPVLLVVAALMTTLSRHAWVGLIVGGAVIALAGRSRKVGLFMALAVALTLFATPHAIRERAKNIANLADTSVVKRFYMWESGLRMWLDKKLLGFGPGQVKYRHPSYANPKKKHTGHPDPYRGFKLPPYANPTKKYTGHLHNNVVQMAVERGALGLGAWLWAWVGYFVLVVRRIRDTRDAPFGTRFRVVGGLAVAAGFLSAGMFEYNFGDSEVVMLMFFASALPFVGGTDEAR